MNGVLSADWVLPIEGPPIQAGAVVIEDGRITAVGTHSHLLATNDHYRYVISSLDDDRASETEEVNA